MYWIVVVSAINATCATGNSCFASYGALAHYETLAECQAMGEDLIRRHTDIRGIDLEWYCKKVGPGPSPSAPVIIHNADKDEH